jgi:hypothetical protein
VSQPLRQSTAPGQMRQLQCHLSFELAVGTFGEPYGAHAAAAQLRDQTVGADHVAGCGFSAFGQRIARARHPRLSGDDAARLSLRVHMGREQLAQGVLQRRTLAGERVEPGCAIGR